MGEEEGAAKTEASSSFSASSFFFCSETAPSFPFLVLLFRLEGLFLPGDRAGGPLDAGQGPSSGDGDGAGEEDAAGRRFCRLGRLFVFVFWFFCSALSLPSSAVWLKMIRPFFVN